MKTAIATLFAALALSAMPVAAQTSPADTEMARMFRADQAIRSGIKAEQYRDRAFVDRMIAEDKARLVRTGELLQQGKLTTADDLYYAAFIFQHGHGPDEYLRAHSLAMAAMALGRKDASWIAAATLDRYLQAIGQKQVYGTQYMNAPKTGPTMEPYDRGLIPDSLRALLGVPAQAAQQKRLDGMKTPAPAAH